MTRKFLRGLSLWIAAGTGTTLAYGYAQILYLESVVRARRLDPHAGVCVHGYFEFTVIAVAGAVVLGVFLVAWFWRCYDRSGVDSVAASSQ